MLFNKQQILSINEVHSLNGKETYQFSYSTLSMFDTLGRFYFTQERKPPGKAMIFGQLVEDFLCRGEEYVEDNYKQLSYETPTASLKVLADSYVSVLLTRENLEYVEDHDLVNELIKDNDLWKSMVDLDKLKKKYDNSLFWNYIKAELEKVTENDKQIISHETWMEAYQTAETFLIDDVKKEFEDKYIKLQPKFYFTIPIIKERFQEISRKEYDFISIPDIAIYNKDKEFEYFIDLKIKDQLTPNNFIAGFLNFRYDIQNSLYSDIQLQLEDSKFDNKFLVGSKKLSIPQFFSFTDTTWEDFETKTKRYKGITTLIEEYEYYQENGSTYPIGYLEHNCNKFGIFNL